MDRSGIEEKLRDFASGAAEKNGAELVHVELAGSGKRTAVRVFIDKTDGVGHDDCAAVSHELESRLDAADIIPGSYILEVSSPGIERGLYSASDYEKFVGEDANLRTHSPIEGQRNFRGRIAGCSSGEVVLEDRTSGTVRIPIGSIARANLEFDIERELRQGKKKS